MWWKPPCTGLAKCLLQHRPFNTKEIQLAFALPASFASAVGSKALVTMPAPAVVSQVSSRSHALKQHKQLQGFGGIWSEKMYLYTYALEAWTRHQVLPVDVILCVNFPPRCPITSFACRRQQIDAWKYVTWQEVSCSCVSQCDRVEACDTDHVQVLRGQTSHRLRRESLSVSSQNGSVRLIL
jgi:hypothetical protein